ILTLNGISHDVLNAKQHIREAEIIMHAGEPKHVTIATNMAGRGTDIKLTPESVAAGGLYILGTERHESRRIDNQLRGRSGRQGDPGESRFYISLEDDLIHIFAGEKLQKNMKRFGMTEDEAIESKWVSKTIENAQEKVEKQNFEIRKHLLEYDDVLNQQRIVIYTYRREILEGATQIYGLVRDFITKMVQDIIAQFCPKRSLTAEQIKEVFEYFNKITGLDTQVFEKAGISYKNSEEFKRDIVNFLLEQYSLFRKGQQDDRLTQGAEKWLMLETIDHAWKRHMLNLDHLKEGISLRSWGQKNPLIEYKKEAFTMFQDMMCSIRVDIVHHIFHLNLERFNHQELEEKRKRELEQLNLIGGDSGGDSSKPVQRTTEKVGRNDPCPCGSGKKYKKCCGS
ncbi:preprotein translocase subunit SecA, partial [Candidatus Dependentiae bacterium]